MSNDLSLPTISAGARRWLVGLRREHIERWLGRLVFLAVLVWFYRNPPGLWTTHLPALGDVLEAFWQTDFWRNTVLSGEFQPISKEALYPLGVHQMSIAHAGVGLLLLPISIVAGSAVAVNMGFVGGFILCYLGARAFLSRFTPSPFLASIGATVFTFALGRSLHIHGHLHMLLGSTAIAWMAAALMTLRQRAGEPNAWRWAVVSGVCWGLSIIAQPYFVFLGAVPLLLLGAQRRAWKYALAIAGSALIISAPFLSLVAQGMGYMSSLSPTLSALSRAGATPGNYVGWGRLTIWKALADLTAGWRDMSRGIDQQNWGVLTAVLAAVGAVWTRHAKSKRSALILLAAAGILSFGPFWGHGLSQPPLFERVNDYVWQAGAQLKPEVFDETQATLKQKGIPLPGMLPLLLVPRYEFARFVGRYAIVVGLGAVALSVVTLNRLPKRWAALLGCLWIVELLPQPRQPTPLPIDPHPAHAWAAQQLAGHDRAAYDPVYGMESVYSHHLAGHLAGANVFGSFAPTYMQYTYPWITFGRSADPRSEALTTPAHAAILRRAQIRIVLLRPAAAELARKNSALHFAQCFEPGPAQYAYYKDTLCAFEVLPNPDDFFTIQPIAGFSQFEHGRVWVEGTYAQAGWWMDRPATRMVEIVLRAYCPETSKQSVVVKLNGQPIAAHDWSGDCWQAWPATLTVSGEQLRAGLNRIEVEAASAAQPYLFDPATQDRRRLSVLVERLRVLPTN